VTNLRRTVETAAPLCNDLGITPIVEPDLRCSGIGISKMSGSGPNIDNISTDNVSLNIVLPVEAERSLAIFEWYLPEKDHGAPAAKASVEFSDQIQVEDVGICEIVQKNLHSRSYSRGRFSVKQEKGVHAFHRMYGGFMQR